MEIRVDLAQEFDNVRVDLFDPGDFDFRSLIIKIDNGSPLQYSESTAEFCLNSLRGDFTALID